MSDEIMVFYGGEVPGILTRLRNAKRNADQISILAKSVAANIKTAVRICMRLNSLKWAVTTR